MFLMGLLKMYKGSLGHKMLIAATEHDAAMYAVPLEYNVKLIA